MWTPDSELEKTTVSLLEEAVATRVSSAAEALALLEAVGTMVALGKSAGAVPLVPPALRAEIKVQLATVETPDLDDAFVTVLELAPLCLTLDPSVCEEELHPLLAALDCRDRIELQWIGAEALDMGEAWSDEAQASRLAYDEGVAEELWQLLPLEGRRTVEVEWMMPSSRTRFWWRTRGAELPGTALSDAAQREAVLKVFPQAKTHLDALAKFSPKPRAKVLSLADAIRRRHQPQTHRLVAAAAAQLRALYSDEFVEVSLEDPDQLVVDVLAPLEASQVPVLEFDGHQRIDGRASPLAPGRFRFSLSGLGEGTLVLRLPLVSGPRTVEVK